MADFTNKEDILMNSFMYIGGSDRKGSLRETVEQLIEKYENDSKLHGGAKMDNKECLEVLYAMRNDEKLMKLKAVDSIKTDIQAVCYVNSEDKEANIVVRGSGGDNEAWQENTNLAYEYETRLQKEFGNVYKKWNEEYGGIDYVTGHSLGGNLAQFGVIKYGDDKVKCTAYDSPGFSQAFIEGHADGIVNRKDQIKMIAASTDYVNVLNKQITDNTEYIDIDDELCHPQNSHKSTKLLDSALINENGDFKEDKKCKQNLLVKYFGKIINLSERGLSEVPSIQKAVNNGVGIILGYCLGDENKWEYTKSLINKGKEAIENKLKIVEKVPGVNFLFKELKKIGHGLDKVKDTVIDGAKDFLHIGKNKNELELKQELNNINKKYEEQERKIAELNSNLNMNINKYYKTKEAKTNWEENCDLLNKYEGMKLFRGSFYNKHKDLIDLAKNSKDILEKNSLNEISKKIKELKIEQNKCKEEMNGIVNEKNTVVEQLKDCKAIENNQNKSNEIAFDMNIVGATSQGMSM